MATFYVRFHFLLLARFFVVLSVFLIYFYCFLMIWICFSTDFMTYILKNPRKSMTSAKRSNVQTKQNQHIMADDFRLLVTLAPGFTRAALRAAARGQQLEDSVPKKILVCFICLIISMR